MKKILAVAGLFFAVSTASAQGTLEQGNLQVNAGVGLSTWGLPVVVGLDYGIARDFTIGAEASYRSKSETVAGLGKWKLTSFGIAANGNYHFNRILNIPSEFDFYAGLSLGYWFWTYSANGKNFDLGPYKSHISTPSDFNIYAQVGGRYFFSKNFGVNLEFGGGTISGGKAGITYKF